MGHSYDDEQVQEWVDQVETALDLGQEFWGEDQELADLYTSLERHYEASQKYLDDGELDNAFYELEVAYDLLESKNVVDNLVKALHMDYDEFVGDGV